MILDLAALHRELGIPADYAAHRGCPPQPEAAEAELVSIGGDIYGRDQRLIVPAAQAWQAMVSAAAADGVGLQPVSAFRGIEYQAGIVRRKLAAGQPIGQILKVSAAPGYSEHHTGRAVDIATAGADPLVETFADTPAFAWLTENAGKFGFKMSYPRDNPYGMIYEPWHWAFQLDAIAL
ncbi:MAG TPA: M15 family metallopeptidase [Gammaproteobacteria bacterium]|jgi:D-alanyl-D-alanine carboxypeptidase|nr:M15 family metallopeptidase [Gammaproteobacteria bacterium]